MAAVTGLPPSAATGLPGSLSPRSRSSSEYNPDSDDQKGYTGARKDPFFLFVRGLSSDAARSRGGTDSVLIQRDSTLALSALLTPQKYALTLSIHSCVAKCLIGSSLAIGKV